MSALPASALVLEDQAETRQHLLLALAVAFPGIDARGAGDLRAARDLLDPVSGPAWTPDLALVDLVLPDGSGGDVAQRIAELRPEIRVLYVSGYTDDPALRRGISENEMEFLSKPFSPTRLLTRVREVLERPVPRRAPSLRPN